MNSRLGGNTQCGGAPLISVVVAAKNEEHHLRQALCSILAQNDVNLELVFVDDGSNDRTLDIACEIGRGDRRLSVYSNQGSGKCSGFNFGVSKARGAYVCIFSGDDVMPQGSLRGRLDAIQASGQETAVIGLSKLVTMSDVSKFDGFLIPRAKGVGALSGVSPLMNRKALELVFPVPEFLPNEDTWMELAVLHLEDVLVIHSNVVACRWRVHSGNSINMMLPFAEYNSKVTARFRALPVFYEKFKDSISQDQSTILRAKMRCEESRVQGDMVGVMLSGAGFVDRLRALSITNGFLFWIRRSCYGLFSGW
ncbi:glycosyltransferase family 2 protein [Accumulibacter sp.]|uniref:glycosyltransferase family 2 protein n=1 Tax=Accumulibacter sp. TaxID=2053492 RepID=UPI0028C4C0C5|nr:glycosyltransferase family 2 protein [Accumulibacter sp.]